MKILIADRLLKGKANADWKEGWEFFYAFLALGHEADIAGPDCPIDECLIPEISPQYDFILITENYWDHPFPARWKWWDWAKIRTPKIFFAVDTHLVNYVDWTKKAKIDFVLCNNAGDRAQFSQPGMWFPYGVSRKHFGAQPLGTKKYDSTFIGNITTEERRNIIKNCGIKHLKAFGRSYVKEMQASRICVNIPMSYDLNAKSLEIMASGAFLLCKRSEALQNLINAEFLQTHFWDTEEELNTKIAYFLEHSDEREQRALEASNFVLANHSVEARAKTLIDFVNEQGFTS